VQRYVTLGLPRTATLPPETPRPKLTVNIENQQRLIDHFKLDNKTPTIALMPGAEYGPAKRWPEEHYAGLTRMLMNEGFQVLIFGSEKEAALADKIISLSGNNAFNLCGKTRLEDAIDLIAREGRKYGLNVFLVSQTIRDFTHSAATIRQNTTTKVFMRSSDRELDYAADYIRDPRQLTSLQPGEAIVCNPLFGSVKVRVRPPFSKVIELSARDSATLLGGAASPSSTTAASDEAEALLRVVEDHYRETGEPIIMSHAMIKIGVTSGRKKMALVNILERQGLIRTQKLKKLGAPRVLFPVE